MSLNKETKPNQTMKSVVLDAALLYTQHYNVRIKDKVEQSRQ